MEENNKLIAEKLFSDIYSYEEFIKEYLTDYLDNHPSRSIYWSAWFDGATGSDLEDADKGIVYNKTK